MVTEPGKANSQNRLGLREARSSVGMLQGMFSSACCDSSLVDFHGAVGSVCGKVGGQMGRQTSHLLSGGKYGYK